MIFDSPGAAPVEGSARYRALIDRLYALAKSGMTLGLEPMARVLAALGDPQKSYPAIHIAGSNGKGSTSAFTAAILAAHGLKVGLYTSPHLVSLTERIQIVSSEGPAEISEDEFVEAIEELETVAPDFAGLSFFEAITAAGLLVFRRRKVDFAVVEAGLGARLDATRLVEARASVLTDLALEHTEILGDSLAKIAAEKIFVVRPGRPLVAANAPAEAQVVIDREARAMGAGTFILGREISVRENSNGTFDIDLGDRELLDVSLSLLGAHQGRNATLAAKVASLVLPDAREEAIRYGLESAYWPGRLEVLRTTPPVLLDGAHNAEGAQILASALSARRDLFAGPLHIVFGVLSDKDARTMVLALAPLARSMIFTRPGSARARDPREVSMLADPAKSAVIDAPIDALREAQSRARADGGWVVVCGSLYLIGDVRALLLSGAPPS